MYNVFLVEDEIVVREGVRNSIEWDKTEFNLCGEAPDGEIALDKIKELNPDIVITDIKMPFMNGLDLARILKRDMPSIKIIILTGYDEFDFVKEAISIGANEYLVKPIDPVELILTLRKMSDVIKKEREEKQNIENLKKEIQSIAYIQKEHILNNLVLGIAKNEEVIKFAEENNINLLFKYFLVILISLEAKENDYKEYLNALNCIKSTVNEDENIIFFSSGNDRIIMILKSFQKDGIEKKAFDVSTYIKENVENKTRCNVLIALGGTVQRVQDIHLSYQGADKILKYIFAFRTKEIMSIKDVYNDDIKHIYDLEVINKVKYAEESDIDNIIYEFMSFFKEFENISMFIKYNVLIDIIEACSKMITSSGGNAKIVLKDVNNVNLISWEIEDKDSFREVIRGILIKFIKFKNEQKDGLKYENIIKKAKIYIENNYQKEQISLKSVAEEVALSPNHFSTIFSQEMKETFIEYLTKVRIKKAKELLINTDKSLGFIAYNVGYNEPHYFSSIFKKHCNMTPREYRKKYKNNKK